MNIPNLVYTDDLSIAWAKAFLLALNSQKNKFSTTLISLDIEGSSVKESQQIINLLRCSFESLNDKSKNKRKRGCKYVSISENASLIFPQNLWSPVLKKGYAHFFELYEKRAYPRLVKADMRNRLGTYFLRMIPQLKLILEYWNQEQRNEPKRRVRRSALQASCVDNENDNMFFRVPIFDPNRDHQKTKMRGFPCLQQVSFCWNDENELSVAAYYPTQYVFDRGYGNYLGLCDLGFFMANEMGLKFTKLNCFINVLELGTPSKGDVEDLRQGLMSLGVNDDKEK